VGYMAVWSWNVDVFRYLTKTASAMSSAEDFEHYTFAVHIADSNVIQLSVRFAVADFGTAFNETAIDDIVEAADLIEYHSFVQILKYPLSALVRAWTFAEHREYDLPYVRRVRTSNTALSGDWIDSFANEVDAVLETNGTYGSLMVSFTGSNVGASNNVTALSHRDSKVFVTMDMFYDEEENPSLTRDAFSHTLDAMWSKWIWDGDDASNNGGEMVLFGDGSDNRHFAFTFGDVNISNVWKYYVDSAQKFDRLRRAKYAADPTNLFSNQFTIPPFFLNETVSAQTDESSLSESDIALLTVLGIVFVGGFVAVTVYIWRVKSKQSLAEAHAGVVDTNKQQSAPNGENEMPQM